MTAKVVVQQVYQLSTAGVLVQESLVHPVYQESETSTPAVLVRHFSGLSLVHLLYTLKVLPGGYAVALAQKPLITAVDGGRQIWRSQNREEPSELPEDLPRFEIEPSRLSESSVSAHASTRVTTRHTLSTRQAPGQHRAQSAHIARARAAAFACWVHCYKHARSKPLASPFAGVLSEIGINPFRNGFERVPA